MVKSYKNKFLASVHEAIADAHDAGIVDKKTMRSFDEACLTTVEKLSRPRRSWP